MALHELTARPSPDVVLRGTFGPKLRIYLFAYGTMAVVGSVVGIVLLPLWLVIGPFWVRRYHAALRCDLTERSVVIGKGLLFRRELTIPLDRIQDIAIHEGPLLAALGLLRLRIETAGQRGATGGRSDADLIGLIDARAVRDRILERRDALASGEASSSPGDPDRVVLVEIRDSLLRIERALAAR